jgi:hypothetical protein
MQRNIEMSERDGQEQKHTKTIERQKQNQHTQRLITKKISNSHRSNSRFNLKRIKKKNRHINQKTCVINSNISGDVLRQRRHGARVRDAADLVAVHVDDHRLVLRVDALLDVGRVHADQQRHRGVADQTLDGHRQQRDVGVSVESEGGWRDGTKSR